MKYFICISALFLSSIALFGQDKNLGSTKLLIATPYPIEGHLFEEISPSQTMEQVIDIRGRARSSTATIEILLSALTAMDTSAKGQFEILATTEEIQEDTKEYPNTIHPPLVAMDSPSLLNAWQE